MRGHSSLYTRLSPGTRKCNGRLTTEALSSAAYSYSDCCTGLGQSDHNKETLSLSLRGHNKEIQFEVFKRKDSV